MKIFTVGAEATAASPLSSVKPVYLAGGAAALLAGGIGYLVWKKKSPGQLRREMMQKLRARR